MYIKQRNFILFFLTLGLVAMYASCSDDDKGGEDPAPPAEAVKSSIQSLLDEYTKNSKLPGVAAHVILRDESFSISAGKANLTNASPIEDDAILFPQSISKTFTAVAIMQLVEQGKITLDGKISAYLPASIFEGITNSTEITVRQLLNHTSGIPNYVEQDEFILDVMKGDELPFTSEKILSYVAGKPAENSPGAAYYYSDTNYHLLALIINAVADNHGKIFREKIQTPLALHNTYYLPYESDSPVLSTISRFYSYDDALEQYEDATDLQILLTMGGIGDDGFISSAEDIAVFYRQLFKNKLVTAASLIEMKKTPTGSSYGLGMYNLEIPGYGKAWGHSGAGLAGAAEALYFEDLDIAVVLMSNTGVLLSEKKNEIFQELWAKVVFTAIGRV